MAAARSSAEKAPYPPSSSLYLRARAESGRHCSTIRTQPSADGGIRRGYDSAKPAPLMLSAYQSGAKLAVSSAHAEECGWPEWQQIASLVEQHAECSWCYQ